MLRWSLILLVACGQKTSPPADPDRPPLGAGGSAQADGLPIAAPDAPLPLDRDYPRMVSAAIAMYDDLRAALAATTDCAVATSALGEVQTRYADLIAANATVAREGRIGELRAAFTPHDEQFAAAAKAVMELPVLPACAKDTAFTRAFGRFTGG